MHVMGVTGLPGSGKSVVARVAGNLGISVIRMGDVIRDEALKRNADIGETAVKLRKEYGKYVVALRCIQFIEEISNNSTGDTKFIIEGIRSPEEVEIFRKHFPDFKVITVHSSPKIRFMRLKGRQRSDAPNNMPDFINRDERELNFGIGNVIATSDFMIVNEGPLWKLKKSIKSILKHEMLVKNKK
ncbi:MAG: AAA family ATPase [Methanobacterium sp.]